MKTDHSGNMGYTTKINLGDEKETSGVYYVKFSHSLKNVRRLDEEEEGSNFLNKIFEREFLLLQLLNLLGIKTPTEIALLKYQNGSILIKRAAGDGERRDKVSRSNTDDLGYANRLNILIKTLTIEDVEKESGNVVPLSGRERFFPTTRNAIVDPILGAKGFYSDTDDILTIADERLDSFDLKLPSLQKIAYLYRQNAEKITPILSALDKHFEDVVFERKIFGNFTREKIADSAKQQDKFPINLSARLERLVELIEERSKKLYILPYEPNHSKKYIAKRVTPLLDDKTISFILQQCSDWDKVSGLMPETFDAEVWSYSVPEGENRRNVAIDLNSTPQITFLEKLHSIQPKSMQSPIKNSCVIS